MKVKRNLRILTKASQASVRKAVERKLDEAEIVATLSRAKRKRIIRNKDINKIIEIMNKVKEFDSVNTIICRFYGDATLEEMQKFAQGGFPEQSKIIITLDNGTANTNKHKVVLCWNK